jgi:NAD(P)-dependent dehydrogenase (short-subunit alcohol dehydrogenase family)
MGDTDEGITPEERDACVRVLQRLADDPSLIQDDERVKALIAKIHRTGKKGERRSNGEQRRSEDRALRAETAMVRRDLRRLPLAQTDADEGGALGSLRRAARCYICKQDYAEVHFFYHALCPECAALNYAKRRQRTDLSGRIALLTGGRIKIGYQLTLRLLRDGARVIVTTRFPADAARRFQAEHDAGEWRGRLSVRALDLRDLPAVEAFAQDLLDTEPHLDILINNAAQTVKRPLAFYRHLLEGEDGTRLPVLLEAQPRYSRRETAGALPPAQDGEVTRAALAAAAYFPAGLLDPDGQQEDHRPDNSWALRLGEVGTLEALEVHLVNAVAPFVLCGRLRPLLARSPFLRRFVVNVSAMEGQFARNSKTPRHPHTNMAKAALNMLTRTSAADFAKDGIYMNSVDTGWVTDENPHPTKLRVRERDGFYTPLDVIDGAARVYDPIARGVTEPEEPLWGHFLKDYAPYPW